MIPHNAEEFKSPLELSAHRKKMASIKRILKRGMEIKIKLFQWDMDKSTSSKRKSIRPTPQEADKWKHGFDSLLGSKYGLALFKAFLQREFSDENLEFWLAVEEFRKPHDQRIDTKAQEIYNTFVSPQSPKEIHLDSETKALIISQLRHPNINLFDRAQRRIRSILEADAYARFCTSDLYLELVYPERYKLGI